MDSRAKTLLVLGGLAAVGAFLLVRRVQKKGAAGTVLDLALGEDIREKGLLETGREIVFGPPNPDEKLVETAIVYPTPDRTVPLIPSPVPSVPVDAFPSDGSVGLVSSSLTSPVVAAILDPRPAKTGRRDRFGSKFKAKLGIKSYAAKDQLAVVDVRIEAHKFALFGDGRVVTDATVFHGKVKPGQYVEREIELDSGSTLDVGDLDVSVTVRVNKVITQTVGFSLA